MKRILSFVLSLVFVIGMLPCFGVSAETSDDMTVTDRVIQQMRDLGIVEGDENGDIEPTATLSRAEFVTLIARIMNMEDIYAETENDLFVDVTQNYWAKSAILACAKAGYINGTDPGMFSPEDNVSMEQAVKIMIRVLGYEYLAQERGGYPAGHIYAATRLELLDNITTEQTEAITKGDAAHLFFNALEVTLTEEVGYSGSSVLLSDHGNRTILGEYMGLARGEATLDAIYGCSVTDAGVDDQNQIVVGGVLYEYDGRDLRDLIGRTVDYFYTIGEKQLKSTVKSILPAEDANHEVTVELADLVDAGNGEIQFTDANENEQKVKVTSEIKYIYNYELLLDYDITNLKTIANGKIVLVDNNDDRKCDVAFIYDFATCIVSSKTDSMIQGKNNSGYIDLVKDARKVYLSYYDGREVLLSKIKENHILFVVETDEILDMKINDSQINGVYETLGNKTVTISGTKYDVAKDLYAPGVSLGDSVTVYFNPNQEVCYMEVMSTASLKAGYLYRLAETEGTFSGGMMVKIFTEDGDLVSLTLADRIAMNDNSYNLKKNADLTSIKNNLDWDDRYNIRPQMVKYQMDADGKICILDTAATSLSANEDGFLVFFGAGTDDGATFEDKNYESQNFYNSDGDLILGASPATTKVFTVPKRKAIGSAEESDFRLSTVSEISKEDKDDSQKLNQGLTIYTNSKTATVADYVVITSDFPNKVGKSEQYLEMVAYVTGTTIWEDGEAREAIEYFGKNGLTSVKVPDYLSGKLKTMNTGDAIIIATDWNGDLSMAPIVVYDLKNDVLDDTHSSTYYYDYSVSYVVYESDGSLRLNQNNYQTKDSTMFTTSLLLSADTNNIYLVKTQNGKTTVSKGSATDIVVGDKVAYKRSRGTTDVLIVYKDLD